MSKKTIYTHEIAADILDDFEELLEAKNITIPDEARNGDEDEARLYGESYSALLDSVEEKIITLLEGLDCNLIKHTFQ